MVVVLSCISFFFFFFFITDTDTGHNTAQMATGWGKTETGEQLSKSYKSASRSGTEENLRVEVKADSDVRSDDRRGKEETRFLWTRLSLNTSTPV